MSVWRPCDKVESAVAWKAAIERQNGPTSLIFSRQNLPHQARSDEQVQAISRGGYILKDCDLEPTVIVLATGSEVSISLAAVESLQAEGVNVRLVSIPCVDVFEAQDAEYIEQVLPNAVRQRVAVEAAGVDYWRKFVGLDGKVVGMQSFGESAPGAVLMEHFGFTAENIIASVKSLG